MPPDALSEPGRRRSAAARRRRSRAGGYLLGSQLEPAGGGGEAPAPQLGPGRRPVEIAVAGAPVRSPPRAVPGRAGSTSSSPPSRTRGGGAGRTYVAAHAVGLLEPASGAPPARPVRCSRRRDRELGRDPGAHPRPGAAPDPRRELRPRGAADRALSRQPSSSASNACRASAPRTQKTTRSSPLSPSRWRRTSSTSIRAASASGKPPTPVPKATSAERAGAELVGDPQGARRRLADDLAPRSGRRGAWSRRGSPSARAARRPRSRPPRRGRSAPARRSRAWIESPPARTIAPATPPPWRSSVLAALAIASTSSSVMSASSTSISATA